MIFEGEQYLPVSEKRLWHLLMDPGVLAVVIPGCSELEQTDAREYSGTISAKIGPIESRFETDFTISDIEFPNRFRLHVMGQGGAGFVTFDVQINLIGQDEESTLLRYSADADVGGRLAAVGQRLIKAAAGTMIKKGFNNLRSRVEEEEAARDSTHPSNSAHSVSNE